MNGRSVRIVVAIPSVGQCRDVRQPAAPCDETVCR